MKIVIFGLTITSAWGNGHATTFRSLVKALKGRGHQVYFIEKDVEWYRNNRDVTEFPFCTVKLYDEWPSKENVFVDECRDADAIVVGSYFPDAIAATSALLHAGCGPLIFYDIDTPITLAGLLAEGSTAYLDAAQIPFYDAYLSFSGGQSLELLEVRYGAKQAIAFYCSVDADLYAPADMRDEFRCDLSYLGTYAADRQAKLMRLLNRPAEILPRHKFVVAGAMYPEETPWQRGVTHLTHVAPPQHPAFYSSARFTLNLTRNDMVVAGYSPSVRLFEASACGAAIISDDWKGLSEFLTPGEQILLPQDEYDVSDLILNLSDAARRKIGESARERILSEHTSSHRAAQFETIVASLKTTTGRDRQTSPGIGQADSAQAAHANKSLCTPQ